MEKTIYLNELYDYYQELLTEKQQMFYEEYYFHNLSLSEIANKLEISRNAVYNQIKTVEKKLLAYEDKLKMNYKKKELIKKVDNVVSDKLLEEIKEIL